MRRSASLLLAIPSLLTLFALSGCGDDGSTSRPTGGTASGSSSSGEGGAGGAGGAGGSGGCLFGCESSSSGSGGAGGAGGGGDICVSVQCNPDQHCEPQNGAPVCVNNTCGDLNCLPTEICETTMGGGAICKDISCSADVECPPAQYCNGTICVDDVCSPGAQTCMGQELHECAPNGGGDVVKYICGSQSYFTSTCDDPGMGDASCPCEDDWDCPQYTVCEVGTCVGTGKAPTCTLPPAPFQSVLPKKEIQWGGVDQSNKNAVNAPFPLSSQVSATPLVINLDDDNGDGLINELDFPEIVFMTYCGTSISQDGIVRAVHGGGPNKGKDYFANAGANVWHEGEALNVMDACLTGLGNSTAILAAGDLDYDGIPEIVVPNDTTGLTILDNRGEVITSTLANQWPAGGYQDPAPSIANIDNKGFAEIVVGNKVFTLDHDMNGKLIFVDRFTGALMQGTQSQGPVPCVANIAGDSRLEIIGGTTVYALPDPPAGVTKRADCAAGDMSNFCLGNLTVVWDGQTVNGPLAIPAAKRDGFCAIADILGADEVAAPGPANPLDGKPEVILINDGFLLVLNGETGTLRRSIDLMIGLNGGAPNVDDFDGDGFPEVGTAFGARYAMIDLQAATVDCPAWTLGLSDAQMGLQGNPARNPGGACAMDTDCASGAVCGQGGTCLCLHNSWQRITEDNSSEVTASSVFDFNGDGSAEVIYNDECYFRIYSGTNGDVLFKSNSPSRTRIENPTIADVDNDGNAEIVFASNNDTNSCSVGNNFPNGVAVWGDDSDTWVSARRIWNEHAYHVTNVLEGGGIPIKEPESWKPYNGRLYNTYRSNPRSFGVAPDLGIKGIQVSSPDAKCGQLSKKLDITVEIVNNGDIRVGPGVVVTFYGEWLNQAVNEPLYANIMMVPLTATLQSSIEPGGSILVTVSYDAANNMPNALPDNIKVVVDEGDKEKECDEANNTLLSKVDPGMLEPDLRVILGVASANLCPTPEVETTIVNDGSAPASDITVRYYAGDPNQGGTVVHNELVPGPIPAGGMTTFKAKLSAFPANLSILVFAVVDPDNKIKECNDGNNKDAADNKIICDNVN